MAIDFITIHSASDDQAAPKLREMIREMDCVLDRSRGRLTAGSLRVLQDDLGVVIGCIRDMRDRLFRDHRRLLFQLREAQKYLSAAAEKIDSEPRARMFFGDLVEARKHLEQAQHYF